MGKGEHELLSSLATGAPNLPTCKTVVKIVLDLIEEILTSEPKLGINLMIDTFIIHSISLNKEYR
jgi:hypothetical protein